MSFNQPVISDPRVEKYLLDLVDATDFTGLPASLVSTLAAASEHAEQTRFPNVGPLVGRALCMNAGLVGARRILDAGTGLGISALWLAAGAGPGARIVCVDTDATALERAREFHTRAGLGVEFEYRVGDALEVLEADPGPFDVVFNDIDKAAYPRMARLAVPRLRPGGIYMADNALWYGKVCLYGTTWDAWTTAVHQHNDWLFRQPNLFSVIYDLREGVLVSVKRS